MEGVWTAGGRHVERGRCFGGSHQVDTDQQSQAFVSDHEEELERPSFLRRLRRRKGQGDDEPKGE